MKKRTQRHDVIRAIVRANDIRTQRDLGEHLQEAGYECTQATVSRDIAELGLVKSEAGVYVLPEDMRLVHLAQAMVEQVDVAGHLVVIRTIPGGAAGVAGAIDDADLAGALGSVAGDDTIMIAARTPEDAEAIAARLSGLRRR